MTYQIIYSSRATAPMSVDDLERILVDARAGNEKRNVTGALVYVDGVFLQVIEGDKEILLGLMRSIGDDSRHSSVKIFHQAEIERPMFANWRMAFVSATPGQMAIWAGLHGTASIESILDGIHNAPDGGSRMAETILRALAP
jgi:Sensors of blue-light using FAD